MTAHMFEVCVHTLSVCFATDKEVLVEFCLCGLFDMPVMR